MEEENCEDYAKNYQYNRLKNNTQSRSYRSLKCFYTNADSLPNKKEEFENSIIKEKPDVVAITEVFPKNSRYKVTAAELNIQGYDLFIDERGQGKRGIIIYCKCELEATLSDVEYKYDGSLWISL